MGPPQHTLEIQHGSHTCSENASIDECDQLAAAKSTSDRPQLPACGDGAYSTNRATESFDPTDDGPKLAPKSMRRRTDVTSDTPTHIPEAMQSDREDVDTGSTPT